MSRRKLNRLSRRGHVWFLGAICLLMPMILGGCPEFQADVVNAVDTAVSGLLNAALDLYFDQFRTNVGF